MVEAIDLDEAIAATRDAHDHERPVGIAHLAKTATLWLGGVLILTTTAMVVSQALASQAAPGVLDAPPVVSSPPVTSPPPDLPAAPSAGPAIVVSAAPVATPESSPLASVSPSATPIMVTAQPETSPSAAAPSTAASASSAQWWLPRPDPQWLSDMSARTGIPARALLAYTAADLQLDVEQPSCRLAWNTLAAIGRTESGHGSHGGATLGDDGYPSKRIVGVPLDGVEYRAIPDSDHGEFDGDVSWDRAVGPMQFIPSTWRTWGADGNGDGRADPNQIDDAALTAGRYLCATSTMSTTEGWRAAIQSYNSSTEYINQIAITANEYAAQAS